MDSMHGPCRVGPVLKALFMMCFLAAAPLCAADAARAGPSAGLWLEEGDDEGDTTSMMQLGISAPQPRQRRTGKTAVADMGCELGECDEEGDGSFFIQASLKETGATMRREELEFDDTSM
mmetsp:Transcript_49352/g.127331  ORF Transcript_49352/g.127331 Transcript_49352/m.127331 type:complete len:120 (-) Transcript_49352:232-591(-)